MYLIHCVLLLYCCAVSKYFYSARIFEGAAGNMPDSESLTGTFEIMKDVWAAEEGDIVLVLVSGGGSALLWCPADGISAEDKMHAIKVMSNAGATIQELNKVRSALSSVKRGQLAEAAYPAKASYVTSMQL